MAKPSEARCDYYIFPHVALRQFAFNNPYMCLGALGSSEGRRFLEDILEAVADYCEGEGQEFTLTPEQIRTHSLKVKKLPCLVVEMPKPRAATEVHFVGIVLKPPAGDTAADLDSAEVRYFTLEKGDTAKQTELCEWTEDSKHLQYGAGPAPDVKKFLEALGNLY